MTIYGSTTAPCFRCRQPMGFCLATCPDRRSPFDAPPTLQLGGDITYPDGHRVLVPQPVKFQSFPATSDPLDGVTITGVIRAVEKGPHSHAEPRMRSGWTRVWVAVVVLAVAALVVAAFVANPVVLVIWSVFHA